MEKRQIKILYDSYKGTNRKCNKDGALVINNHNYALLGIFDGVSSAISSAKAVKMAIAFVKANHCKFHDGNTLDLSLMMQNLNKLLISCDLEEPFTTCSLMYVPYNRNDSIKYSNIGDSRVYEVSSQFIEQLTIDDIEQYSKNVLIKYLGNKCLKQSDFVEHIYRGDASRFLLCSDGFYSIFEGNNKELLEMHHALNINHSYYIKYNISKLVESKSSDDATYVFLRC